MYAHHFLFLILSIAVNGVILYPYYPRLTVSDWQQYSYHEPSGPGTYAFGYDIEDPATNNIQFRNEERHQNGSVTGSYGYLQPDGIVRIVHYVADHKGFRTIEEKGPQLLMLKPIILPQTSTHFH